jgi:hypothetical protein
VELDVDPVDGPPLAVVQAVVGVAPRLAQVPQFEIVGVQLGAEYLLECQLGAAPEQKLPQDTPRTVDLGPFDFLRADVQQEADRSLRADQVAEPAFRRAHVPGHR